VISEKGLDGIERVQYSFSFEPRMSCDFEGTCLQKWTAPESKFVRGLTIARVIGDQRVIINRNRMLISQAQNTQTIPLSGPSELRAKTLEFFGDHLDCESFLDELTQAAVLEGLTL
jgi:arylamine N-acetyltransferase